MKSTIKRDSVIFYKGIVEPSLSSLKEDIIYAYNQITYSDCPFAIRIARAGQYLMIGHRISSLWGHAIIYSYNAPNIIYKFIMQNGVGKLYSYSGTEEQ